MKKSDLLGLSVGTKEITVPGSADTLTIRAMSGAEMTTARKMSKNCIDEAGRIINADMYLEYELFLTRSGLIDEDGQQMLDKDEVREVSTLRHSLIVYVAKQVAILSGLVDGASEAEKN